MLNIQWSLDAKEDYWDNIEYLEKEWTITDAINFTSTVEALLKQLQTDTVTFKTTNYKDTYQVPVVKQVTLFYKIEHNQIILLRFWNNYKDPQNLSL